MEKRETLAMLKKMGPEIDAALQAVAAKYGFTAKPVRITYDASGLSFASKTEWTKAGAEDAITNNALGAFGYTVKYGDFVHHHSLLGRAYKIVGVRKSGALIGEKDGKRWVLKVDNLAAFRNVEDKPFVPDWMREDADSKPYIPSQPSQGA